MESEYSNNSISFKEILLGHIKRITELSSFEMRGGYYTYITAKTGESKEIYVPDTREVYSNAVLCLLHLLKPKFNKKSIENYDEFIKKIEEIKKDFIKKSSVNEEIVLGEGFYTSSQDKILFETYRMKKLKIFQDFFQDICQFLNDKNWLELGGGTF